MYRRRLIAVASALVVLVVVAAGVASAADNDKQSSGQPFALVGTWEVTLMLPGAPPARWLATFNADGTTVESAAVRRPPVARRTACGSGREGSLLRHKGLLPVQPDDGRVPRHDEGERDGTGGAGSADLRGCLDLRVA